jgi:hypothetical protein
MFIIFMFICNIVNQRCLKHGVSRVSQGKQLLCYNDRLGVVTTTSWCSVSRLYKIINIVPQILYPVGIVQHKIMDPHLHINYYKTKVHKVFNVFPSPLMKLS